MWWFWKQFEPKIKILSPEESRRLEQRKQKEKLKNDNLDQFNFLLNNLFDPSISEENKQDILNNIIIFCALVKDESEYNNFISVLNDRFSYWTKEEKDLIIKIKLELESNMRESISLNTLEYDWYYYPLDLIKLRKIDRNIYLLEIRNRNWMLIDWFKMYDEWRRIRFEDKYKQQHFYNKKDLWKNNSIWRINFSLKFSH